MIIKEEFLRKYYISLEDFDKIDLEWSVLEKIYKDFILRTVEFERIARYVSECLREVNKVHSVKYRVKNPEHLIEKIIRKKILKPDFNITLENYTQLVTDLIGVRVLHLFKEDWEEIHNFIIEKWTPAQEKPEANIREGDSQSVLTKFEEKGCKIVVHPFGYRSVHYLIISNLLKELTVAEIQVRTIFEEAWSEIDHQLRYPYQLNNTLLSNYLEIFNRLAGNADEMGSYVKFLSQHLREVDETYRKELTSKNQLIVKLKNRISKLEIETHEKAELEKELDTLDITVGNVLKTYEPLYKDTVKSTLDNAMRVFETIDNQSMQITVETAMKVFNALDKDALQETLLSAAEVLGSLSDEKDIIELDEDKNIQKIAELIKRP